MLISGLSHESHMPTRHGSEMWPSFSQQNEVLGDAKQSASPDSIKCQADGSIASGFLGFLGLGKARHPRNGELVILGEARDSPG